MDSSPPCSYLLHHLLSQAAAETPDREAVRYRGRSMTWHELDVSSNALAQTLVERGVRRGDRVGIYLQTRLETVVSVFGALKAGAAFVGLDARAPVDRVVTIASDCSIGALISTPARAAHLSATMGPLAPTTVVLVPEETGPFVAPDDALTYDSAIADGAAQDPSVRCTDLDLLTLAYTSGSTGIPKGVMHTHASTIRCAEAVRNLLRTGPDDRLLTYLPIQFMGGVIGMGHWLAMQGTMVLLPLEEYYMPGSILRSLDAERITTWTSLAPAFMMLLRAKPEPGSLPHLRRVLFGGATLPTKYVRALRLLIPDAEIWNHVTSSEAGPCCAHLVEDVPPDDQPIPVGRPFPNVDIALVKEDGTVAGPGEEGEMYVRSSTIFKGYWNDPVKTADRLVGDPLGENAGELVCRTGDILRLRADGAFEWVGRSDHQVKVRGYRVDLGEVETAVEAHPSISEAVVVAMPHPEWETALVACVVPETGASITEIALREYLADRLPMYMVPDRIVFRDEMPRSMAGKADRTRLQRELQREPVNG